MMRSLWTAASGMTSQQLNVDTISNNLSNVNTTAYKKERLEFKSLLYETMHRARADIDGTGKPVNLQVGHGVKPAALGRDFSIGMFQRTEGSTDFALEGDGFFVVRRGEDILYTRDGSFKLSVNENGDYNLVTSDGYYVLSPEGENITIPSNVSTKNLSISEEGQFSYTNAQGATVDLGTRFEIVQFSNREGLETVGSNLYKTTGASGEPISELDGDVTATTRVIGGYLEASNVQIAEEMVKLIVAQRAYEINSKAITTSDDMLQTANQLKR